jgi:hypothetical protein
LNLKRGEFGRFVAVINCTLANPFDEQSIIIRIGLKSHPAAMRHLAGGFHEQEALLGSRCGYPSSSAFKHQMLVVFQGLEAQKRKLKTVLAVSGFGVASPRVATGLGQDRNDIVDQTDGLFGGLWLASMWLVKPYAKAQQKQADAGWKSERSHGGYKTCE